MNDYNDEFYIKRTFELAEKGTGFVSPNPLVGSVIVKNGRIIGEGYHQKYGGNHAEINAIESATESVRDATIYCNLEPCCHMKKKTPPCVPRIIKDGIKEVVISNRDPNEFVSGRGIQQLKDAGIIVREAVLEEEGLELNRFFFKHITGRVPYTTIKIAQSLDGYITAKRGKQTWITGESSQTFVHQLRSQYDAVLVGAGTVNVDNPKLNVRNVEGRNPYRIIIDGNLITDPEAGIFQNNNDYKTIIFSTKVSEQYNCRFIRTEADQHGNIDLKKILFKLYELKIGSLLIEGGSEIFSQFINQSLFDELYLIIAPKIYGSGLRGIQVRNKLDLILIDTMQLENDIVLRYKNNYDLKSQTY